MMYLTVKKYLNRIRLLIHGHNCDRCNGPHAKLVIDATPTGKRIDGKTGLQTRTFAVKSANWLCAKCRDDKQS